MAAVSPARGGPRHAVVPPIDADAIASIAEDDRRVVDRHRAFCESEPDLHELFVEAARSATLVS